MEINNFEHAKEIILVLESARMNLDLYADEQQRREKYSGMDFIVERDKKMMGLFLEKAMYLWGEVEKL